MAYISFGEINKNLIPVFIGCVFCFLNRLLNQMKGILLFKNAIITSIYISISRFLTVIPFIILLIRTNRIYNNINDYETEDENNKEIKLIYNDNTEENVEGKFKYILLSAFIYLINSICFVVSFEIKTNSWIWYILIASIFYYLIYKVQIHRHHYFSAALIILIGLLIDLVTKNLQAEIINNFLLL